ncbi:hypothetical protein GCM10027051_22930 [Niabella terrae]
MFKQSVAFILTLFFAAQSFSKVLIVVDYYLNRAAFEARCENKDRPLLSCGGKCQMVKRLKQEQQKDQQSPDRNGSQKNEIVLSSKSFFAESPELVATDAVSYGLFLTRPLKDRPRSIFHPPAC